MGAIISKTGIDISEYMSYFFVTELLGRHDVIISEIQSPLLPKSSIIPQASITDNISLYPVPANNYKPINVVFTSPGEAYCDFRIYDIQGKLITSLLREKVQAGKNMFTFSTSPLKPGIYLLSIGSGQTIFSQKFVVE